MPETPPLTARTGGLNLLLAATALVSAWLLFQVQPMVAKRILPWFGGGAGVWTTAMLFFQAALFVGYLYAHWVTRTLAPSKQLALHATLLAISVVLTFVVGVVPPDAWKPSDADRPIARILLTLGACVGLPYLMLAATAPLVQVWFARANPGRSPYRLYAVSNVGSLAALISYPWLLEPNMGLTRQGLAWSALFAVFAVACAISGVRSLRRAKSAAAAAPLNLTRERVSGRDQLAAKPRYILWLALPACASILLLAITVYISQNVAPIPLLWVLPMVVYLLSFILTFDSDRWYYRPFWMPVAAILSFTAAFSWQKEVSPSIDWMISLHLSLLLAAAMVCHGELARMRPLASRLTSYYLCISAGGALGGLFTGVIAPLIFPDQFELHVGVMLAWALALTVLVTDRKSPFYDGGKRIAFIGLLTMVALFIGVTVALFVHVRSQRAGAIDSARNFYGVLKLVEKNSPSSHYELTNGHIVHGAQFTDEQNRRVPLWYYHHDSGVGGVMVDLRPKPPRSVGVVGLGAGTMAAYAEAGDSFQFYDINPQVIDFAERHFTYLKDARERGADVKIVEGDARLSLERQRPQKFDVLVLDAFNGDAIPMHLLTMEAFDLYFSHLDEDGILAVHITNAYLKLDFVVQAAIERYGLSPSRIRTGQDTATGALGAAEWVLLHREKGYFEKRLFGGPMSDQIYRIKPVVWTDDYTNVFEILKWW
jgi:hypothetical protein